jgi:hypothetical protein
MFFPFPVALSARLDMTIPSTVKDLLIEHPII